MILGIDPGTSCGWCVMAPDGSVLAAGVWNLRRHAKDRRGLLLARAQAEFDAAVGKHKPRAIAYERVFHHSSADAKDLYGGIVGVAEIVADAWDLPTMRVPVAVWKKALTGNGNASALGGIKPPTKTARRKLGSLAPHRVIPSYLAAARAKWPGVNLEEDSAAACGIGDAARRGLHVQVKAEKKRRKSA